MSEVQTALVSVSGGAIVPAGEYNLSGLVPEDYIAKPSLVELVQPINSSEEKTAGLFYDKQSNASFDKMQIVPLEFSPGRVYFPPSETTSAEPLCRSNDGLVPVTAFDNLVPQNDTCKGCPKGQWKKISGAGGRTVNCRPECHETLRFTFLEKETGFVYRFNAKGMSLSPLKNFRETLFKTVMRDRAKGIDTRHYNTTAVMGSTRVVGKKGTFYVLTFGPVSVIPQDELVDFGPIYQRIVLKRFAGEDAPDPAGAIIDAEFEAA